MNSYLVATPLLPGESLLGYAHRVAMENEFETVKWVASDVGIKDFNLQLSRWQCNALAILGSCSPNDLFERQPIRRTHGLVGFLKTDFYLYRIERAALRLCPVCLSESCFHRMVWDLAPLDICPIHHISLIANCPICGDRLLRTGADIFRCPTGHDLTCAAVPPDPRMHLRADAIRVIYGACDHVYTRAGPKASAPFMNGRDPSLLLENLLLLGRIGAALTVPQLRVSERHPTSETLQKGYDLALAWPKNLLALLAASRPDGEQPFAPMFFQWLRRELAYASRRGYGTEIADAIRQYTGERGFNFRSGILSGTVPDERQFISVSAAARCMKVRAGTCIKIARRERWSGWQGLRSGHMCTVRRSDVDAWCAANQTRIIPRVAGKRLGTTAKVIRELVYLGAFGALAQGRTGSGFKQIYLTEEEIASAQERIQEAINYDSNADSITWAGYCRIRRERELKFSHLIASVLSGLVKPTSMSGNTLRSLRFLRQDLFNLSIQ